MATSSLSGRPRRAVTVQSKPGLAFGMSRKGPALGVLLLRDVCFCTLWPH